MGCKISVYTNGAKLNLFIQLACTGSVHRAWRKFARIRPFGNQIDLAISARSKTEIRYNTIVVHAAVRYRSPARFASNAHRAAINFRGHVSMSANHVIACGVRLKKKKLRTRLRDTAINFTPPSRPHRDALTIRPTICRTIPYLVYLWIG